MDSEVDLKEMLSLQLSEIEMLTSMFPDTNEFSLDDYTAISEIKEYIDSSSPSLDLINRRIGYTLKLELENPETSMKKYVEMMVQYPHEYPATSPEVFLRTSGLSRTQYRTFSDALQEYISKLDKGELCMFFIIEWLQEDGSKYLKEDNTKQAAKQKQTVTKFCRMWIYSHHIYSKIKRKAMLEFAEELNLTGFYMPGKPGIIVIEGNEDCVEDFWHRIRRMQWKRLVMKDREDKKLTADDSIDNNRKFEGFEEKYFEPRQGKGRGAHGDRGLLFQYLEEKGCGHIFPMYFGVEGRSAEGDHGDSD